MQHGALLTEMSLPGVERGNDPRNGCEFRRVCAEISNKLMERNMDVRKEGEEG